MRRGHWIALVVGALALEGALTPAYLAYQLLPYAEVQRRQVAFENLVSALEEARRSVGGRGSIGFVCEGPIHPARPDGNVAKYYFAQSWLAPTLVGRELDRGLSLAFFSDSASSSDSLERLNLRVVHPLSNGLALVEGRER